jgi:hypothetical protein
MKNFVIQFESGVVVITDWKENNYLDRNRIKETKYLLEKSMLDTKTNKYILTSQVKPMLNKCSTSIEEYSIEESSKTEEKILPQPKQKPSLKKEIEIKQSNGEIPAELIPYIDDFMGYWIEPDKKGNEKRTKERTWDLILRLRKWKKNDDTNFGRKKNIDYTILDNFHAMMMQERVPELKELLGKDKYFEIKEKWRQSALYLSF